MPLSKVRFQDLGGFRKPPRSFFYLVIILQAASHTTPHTEAQSAMSQIYQ